MKTFKSGKLRESFQRGTNIISSQINSTSWKRGQKTIGGKRSNDVLRAEDEDDDRGAR